MAVYELVEIKSTRFLQNYILDKMLILLIFNSLNCQIEYDIACPKTPSRVKYSNVLAQWLIGM